LREGEEMTIEGVYKRTIFNNSDNGYLVGLIKVTENDIDASLNNKTITFTGYFNDINIEDNLRLVGTFTRHNRYGEQFSVTSYEIIMPTTENSIISFLSSGIFKGIGEGKAKRIYETLGDDCISIMSNDIDALVGIKGISKKNREDIYNTLLEYADNLEIIVKLNEYGFNSKDSTTLYHKYKNKVIELIDEDIYNLVNEDTNFGFKKIDNLALKLDYSNDDIRRIKAGIIYVINEVVNTVGDTYLFKSEIYNYLKRALLVILEEDYFDQAINDLIKEDKLVLIDNKYYLKKVYDAECNIAKRISYLTNLDDNKFKKLNELLLNNEKKYNIDYNSEQEEAIKNSFIKNVLVITGGPGTGKTTIIKSIVSIYQELYKLSRDELYEKITLLAPTGRASKRIMETVNMPASTIHRFLKWNKETNKFGVNEHNKVHTDMVIVDEASMVDTYLLDNLLKGLRFDTKLILVGDVNQLPSVGSGQILKDIIDTEKVPVVKLEKLYRQEANSNIITFAYDVNNGIYDNSLFNNYDDLTYIKTDSYNLMDKFSELCYTYKDYDYNDLIMMAPMYKTINGIDNLNSIAREIFNPKENNKHEIVIGDTLYRENDKVIELVNMPDYNVFNGDIGIITEIDKDKNEVTVDYDGNIVKYTKSNYTNFKLGYVISIHKSQGSEFKVVIMVLLNEFNRMLYRKLLYTGITRAKQNLFILGEEEAIKKAINNNELLKRKTSLYEMINDRFL
jgi:exodeoxyribonuclease V alpha subunit